MAGNAFMGGVKQGGLNSVTEIRLLLCYLIKNSSPVPREVLQESLMQEELVNYFEMAGALADLEKNELAVNENDVYSITDKGVLIADTLADDLPRSVRQCATRAVLRALAWRRKAAQHKAVILNTESGCRVDCSIADMGEEVFSLSLGMPDLATAEAVKERFIADGSNIYALLLNSLTEPLPQEDIPNHF